MEDNVNLRPLYSQKITQQILFITDIEKMIGRNRMTLRRWWLEGKFPVPIKLNGTTLAWHASIVMDWINQSLGIQDKCD